jgi:hypothetical protein
MDTPEYLFNYLNKNYLINNNTFVFKPTQECQWGFEIVNLLSFIFWFDFELCDEVFKNWATSKGFPRDEEYWLLAYKKPRLKARWSPELTQDVFAHGLVEENLILLLMNEIKKELNSNFLMSIQNKEISREEFFKVILCEGYEAGPVLYDPYTFTPTKSFIVAPLKDIINERKNNLYWQNWLRARKCNQKA